MGSSPVIGEPNTSNMKILPLSESLWPVSSLTPKPQLIPPLMLTPILGTATTVALDIMAMAIDSVMAMVAIMVAIVPTAMAMDTMAARRGLLSLNQLLILMLTPGIGTDTMAVLMPAMDITDTDLDTTVAATDTATGARPWARSSDDISYDDIASFPRASLAGR